MVDDHGATAGEQEDAHPAAAAPLAVRVHGISGNRFHTDLHFILPNYVGSFWDDSHSQRTRLFWGVVEWRNALLISPEQLTVHACP